MPRLYYNICMSCSPKFYNLIHNFNGRATEMLFRKRLFALSVALILLLMVAAPSAQTTSPPFPEPVYVSCYTSSGLPAHLLVFFDLSDQGKLTQFLNNAYYDPSSPLFHDFLSASQFDAQYSAPAPVVSAVKSIISSNELTTIMTAPMLIEASGTDIQVQSALTQLSTAPGSVQKFIIGAECMPETIDPDSLSAQSSQVPSYAPTDVRGPKIGSTPMSSETKGAFGTCTPELLSSGSKPSLEAWLPCGLQTIYDENPLLQQGISGSGQTIALVDAYGDPNNSTGQLTAANNYVFDNIACPDLTTFDATFSLPSASCRVIYPTGVPVLGPYNYLDAADWSTETAIDTQYSQVMAPQAHILEVTSSSDYDDLYASVEYVVNHQLAGIMSLSWGEYEDMYYCINPTYGCSPPATAALMLGYDEIFQQAAAQGIGVFIATGDYGAYDPFLSANEVSASTSNNDPWVSGVGGTTLNATFTPSSVFRLEHAWSLGSDYYCLACGSAGGFSMLFKEPLGQRLIHISTQVSSIPEPALGITFYPQGMRGTPDLAAVGDPSTGVLVIQDGVFSPYIWGGTSLSSPLTAGMIATVQSNTRFFAIGDLAPSLYLLYLQMNHGFYVYQTHFSLSDLTHGVPGAMFETAYGQNGPFHVTPGVWNPVDGLGQLNVYGFDRVISSVGYGS